MTELQVGDVVWLKSGSPTMTISNITGNRCHCDWFVNNKKENAVFESEQLTTEDPGKPQNFF